MYKKKRYKNNEIDIIDLLKKIWSYKKLFFITILTSLVVSGLIYKFQPKEFVSKTRLVSPNFLPLNSPDLTYDLKNLYSVTNYFIHFNIYLKSSENFYSFLESNSIEIPKNEYIKIEGDEQSEVFSIIFSQNVNGVKIFNEYIEYTKLKSKADLIERIKSQKIELINILSQSFEIAKNANIDTHIFQNNSAMSFLDMTDKFDTSYFLGTTILSELLRQKKEELVNANNLDFSFEPILLNPTVAQTTNKSLSHYLFLGLIIGVVLFFVIVFLIIVSKVRY